MSRTLLRRLVVVLGITVLGGALAFSCQGGGPDKSPPSDELLLALGQVRNFHHKADVQVEDGHPEAAIESLTQALAVPFPPGAPEAEDVRLDTRARIAKLELGLGRVDDAEQVVRGGLGQSTRESFFQANLHVVLADVLRARGNAHGAIDELDTAIQIEKRLQAKVLEEKKP